MMQEQSQMRNDNMLRDDNGSRKRVCLYFVAGDGDVVRRVLVDVRCGLQRVVILQVQEEAVFVFAGFNVELKRRLCLQVVGDAGESVVEHGSLEVFGALRGERECHVRSGRNAERHGSGAAVYGAAEVGRTAVVRADVWHSVV
jgi:hypothetical protein